MMAQIHCRALTREELQRAGVFELFWVSPREVGWTFWADFDTDMEAQEHLYGVNKYLLQAGKISEAQYQTNIQDVKKNNQMTFDGMTARIIVWGYWNNR